MSPEEEKASEGPSSIANWTTASPQKEALQTSRKSKSTQSESTIGDKEISKFFGVPGSQELRSLSMNDERIKYFLQCPLLILLTANSST